MHRGLTLEVVERLPAAQQISEPAHGLGRHRRPSFGESWLRRELASRSTIGVMASSDCGRTKAMTRLWCRQFVAVSRRPARPRCQSVPDRSPGLSEGEDHVADSDRRCRRRRAPAPGRPIESLGERRPHRASRARLRCQLESTGQLGSSPISPGHRDHGSPQVAPVAKWPSCLWTRLAPERADVGLSLRMVDRQRTGRGDWGSRGH